MSLVLKSLTMRNFLSFGNVPTTLLLNKPGTTIILGEDLDNSTSGTGANGCGKSALINALVYAMYDKPLSDISKDNLVNNINKKNMEVIVEFDSKNIPYKIHRARKMKAGAAGNWVHLFKDGKDITPDSVGATNTLIEKIIGIKYELFVRIVAFSANHIPFLDLPVRSHYQASQTGIIEELFDLKMLSEKADSLKEQIKSTELSLNTHLERIAVLEREHDRHNEQLKSAKKRVVNWELQRQQQVKDLTNKIKKIQNIDFNKQSELHEKAATLKNQIDAISSDIRKLNREIKSVDKIIKEKKSEITHLQDEKCPFCLQQFADAESKLTENNTIIEDSTLILNELQQKLKDTEKQEDKLSKTLSDIQSKITIDNLSELLEIKNEQNQYASKIEDLENSLNPYIEPFDELNDIEIEEINMDEVNKIKDKIEHQKFLLKLLTKKDSFVRKTLLNKNIPYLNKRLTHYLSELGLPHTVEFTHEMTASISQFGRSMEFGNLSNGQRARVNLALSFAFRDVLQNMHQPINVCMLDEVLDVGLDTVGVQAAAKMLKRKARDEKISLNIITHRDEIDNAFDHKLIVQMSKGFSYLNFED